MKNPFVNAGIAAAYIVGIVFVIQGFTSIVVLQKTLLIPIGMLGLFVLSAATMAFLFGYESFRLYFEGKHHDALSFFLKTILTFAILVTLFVSSILLFSLR